MRASALLRNAVTVVGQGPRTLVFGHGLGCDQRSFARLVSHFERSFRVVTFDLMGAGASDRRGYSRERYASLHGHARDLTEICDELGLEGAFYVGHSAGAMVGALAAIAAPRLFHKLVMIGASPRYLDEAGYRGGMRREDADRMVDALSRDYVGWCEQVVPFAVGEPSSSPLTRDLADTFKQMDPKMAEELARVMLYSDHRGDLTCLGTDTLVIQPAVDPFVPLAVGEYIAERAQRAKLAVVRARGGHFPHLGAPGDICALIGRFFEAALG